jgi:multicomponent Na+:H+ antiporter subunit D
MGMLVPLWIMAGACLYFGFDTDITLSASRSAAQGLLSGSVAVH